jgi:hypothetical protein
MLAPFVPDALCTLSITSSVGHYPQKTLSLNARASWQY